MEKNMALLLSVLEQGMIYGILALGVYITYKILDFPDLTVEGGFTRGGANAVGVFKSSGGAGKLNHPQAVVGGGQVGGRLRLCSYF